MFINLKINGRNIKFEIDPLESILSIKSKICHDLLNGRDPDSIQLYFNQKKALFFLDHKQYLCTNNEDDFDERQTV